MSDFNPGRRRVMQVVGAGLLMPSLAPAVIASVKDRPQLTDGVQSGDLQGDRAMIWSRSDRPAHMVVEWDTRSQFRHPRRVVSALADARSDFTARVELTGLPADQAIDYRVYVRDTPTGVASESWLGHRPSAPTAQRNIRFVWSGDTVGQGFGINPDIGGMRIYEAMRLRLPDFFIHSGDTIYADGPVPAQLTTENGRIWRNLTTEAKSKVAQTLDDYRGNYRYNLMDENIRRFNAEVPQIWQWDDHEVVNNWSPGKQLDERYQEKDIHTLVGRARKAWLEYSPMRLQAADAGGRIYRKLSYGPMLDVFVLDMRSYRGANDDNLGAAKAFLGREQLDWLKRGLKKSKGRSSPRTCRLVWACRMARSVRVWRVGKRWLTVIPGRRRGASWKLPNCSAICVRSRCAILSSSRQMCITARRITITRIARRFRISNRSGSLSPGR